MPLATTEERVTKGIARLLANPWTLSSEISARYARTAVRTVSHEKLFAEYLEEVDFVTAIALEWWQETLQARKDNDPGNDQAERKCWEDRPAGPASFPGLVALLRDFWLACENLNKDLKPGERVAPWDFLLGWLLNNKLEQCVSVIACMPYWPIGMDEAGNWV